MLIGFEFRKLLSRRLLWILLACLLCINAAVCYMETQRDPSYFALKKVNAAYEADPEGVMAYCEELRIAQGIYEQAFDAWRRGELPEEPILSLPSTYTGDENYNDLHLLESMLRVKDSEQDYRAELERLIARAVANQEELLYSYFNVTEESYAFRKQLLAEQLYRQVYETTPYRSEMGYGWDQFFLYDSVVVYMALAMILGAAVLYAAEQGGNGVLLRSTKRGRMPTAWAKIAALMGYAALVVLLFTATTWFAVLVKCGAFSSPTNALAVLYDFRNTPYTLTIGEYFILLTFSRIISCFAIAMIVALLCSLVHHAPLGMLGAMLIAGGQYATYMFSTNPKMTALNLMSTLLLHPLVKTFDCLALFDHAITYMAAAFICLVVVTAIIAVLSAMCFCCRSFGAKASAISHAWSRVHTYFGNHMPAHIRKAKQNVVDKATPRRYHSQSILSYEIHKLVCKRELWIALLVLLLFKTVWIEVQYPQNGNYDTAIYHSYMTQLSGEATQEKAEWIDEEIESITAAKENYNSMRSAYLSGKLSVEKYLEFLDDFNYACKHEAMAQRLLERKQHLEKMQDLHGTPGQYLYDFDWEALFSAMPDIVLYLFLILLCTGIFSDEYSALHGCPMALVRTTARGRNTLFGAKFLSAAIVSGLFALLTVLLEAQYVSSHYLLPNSNAPLFSLLTFQNTRTDITLGQFLTVKFILQVAVCVLVSLFLCLIGSYVKSKIAAISLGCVIIFAPAAIEALGVPWFRYLNILRMLTVHDAYLLSCELNWFGDWGAFLLACITLTVIVGALMSRQIYKSRA